VWRSALLVLALGACRNDWRTDMWFQPSHRAQAMPRPVAEGTIALGQPQPLLDIDDSDDLTNPVPADESSVAHGRWLFGERCACCHGAVGKGGGPVSKFFPPAPDLTYVTIRQRSDGHLYGTVTLGGRAMPSQAEGLADRDRWDLVNFVRVLQRGAK
jgi:S-disulfanyl-L-cysteine oxidoreductase SoxD